MKNIFRLSCLTCLLSGLFCFTTTAFAVEETVEEILGFDSSIITYLDEKHSDDLTQLKKRKLIRALVVPSRTDFYLSHGKINGIIVKLLNNYEKHINKGIVKADEKTRIVYVPVNFDNLIPALNEGKGDIAATFLTITDKRKELVDFASSESMNANELVITRKDSAIKLSNLDDLSGRTLYLLNGSSYVEHLQNLNKKFKEKKLKAIRIVEAEEFLTSEDILEMLNAGAIDITVVDDFKAKLWKKVLPNIELHQDLIINKAGKLGWAVRKNNPELLQDLTTFSKTVKQGSYTGNVLFQQFYGRDQKLDNLKLDKERERYSRFSTLFKKYGDQYDINHFKLIAQAYQESGLNQRLRSKSGAIGIMQLLPSTASDKNVNIANIEQIENNIHAGAKYMNFLRTRYFSDPAITPENKIFFAWAAYNAGPAKLRQMRNKAEAMGLDKNVWFKNVEVAAARIVGTETVKYVANIYKYYSTYLLMHQQEALRQPSQ